MKGISYIMKQKDRVKVLCVFGKVLGGKTFSALLDDFLATKDELHCDHIDFTEADYGIKTRNPFSHVSSGAEVSAKMRKKLVLSGLDPSAYDLFFFQSHRLCVPFAKYIRSIPTIVALDATPRSAHRGNVLAYSWLARIKATASTLLDKFWYEPIFKNVDFFLARTALVRDSLIDDYHIAPERIAITYSPLKLATPTSAAIMRDGDKPRLLFIGNDFDRKGGPFLLTLFEKYLQNRCTLTIISKDPSLENYRWPKGVTFIPGVNHGEIFNFYRLSDIFVMPTFKDEMGIVICEAMTAGLPVIARDAGAQAELIDDGKTGFLMPYASNQEQWADRIAQLIGSEALRRQFGQAALEKAKQLFDQETFHQKLDLALQTVLRG